MKTYIVHFLSVHSIQKKYIHLMHHYNTIQKYESSSEYLVNTLVDYFVRILSHCFDRTVNVIGILAVFLSFYELTVSELVTGY